MVGSGRSAPSDDIEVDVGCAHLNAANLFTCTVGAAENERRLRGGVGVFIL